MGTRATETQPENQNRDEDHGRKTAFEGYTIMARSYLATSCRRHDTTLDTVAQEADDGRKDRTAKIRGHCGE